MNLNIKNLASHHKSECPSFRNLKANHQIEIKNKLKGMLRSQSVKENLQLESNILYNSGIWRFNKAKERAKSHFFNFNRKNTVKSKGLINLETAIKNNLKNMESRNETETKFNNQASKSKLILQNLKENQHSNTNETQTLMENKCRTTRCLTERSHQSRSTENNNADIKNGLVGMGCI